MKESGNKALAFPSPHPLHHPHPAKAGCNVRCKPEIYSDTRTAVKYSPRCDTPPHVPRLLSPGLPVCITHLSWYGTKKRAEHRLLAHPPRNTSTLARQTASINNSLRASTRPSSCRGPRFDSPLSSYPAFISSDIFRALFFLFTMFLQPFEDRLS